MDNKNIDEFKSQLKKNRFQSYIFLALLIVSVLLTAYAFYELQKTKQELEEKNVILIDQKEQIKKTNEKLESLNESLVELQGYTEKDSLIKEIIDLVRSSNKDIDVHDISTLSTEQLNERVVDIKKQIEAYDKGRRDIVRQLFAKNETKRVKARQTLLKKYSEDDKLVGDILEELKTKVNKQNGESYYQIIYLLGELDSDMLKAEAQGLNSIYDAGKKAGLHGPSTQKKIDMLIRKMK